MTQGCPTRSVVKFLYMVKCHNQVGSLAFTFFPLPHPPTPFLITYLNQMLIPRYCQNKQSKYGKPEDEGTWHGEQVRARRAHLPERRRSALTTRHGPAVPGCHRARTREQLPGPASRQSLCQPQGAPFLKALRLSCPPRGCKYPLICARTRFTVTNACPAPATDSKPKTFVTEG